MEWIDVHAKLPHIEERVLVCDGGWIEICTFGKNYRTGFGSFFDEQNETIILYPTHWMPLPNTPMSTRRTT